VISFAKSLTLALERHHHQHLPQQPQRRSGVFGEFVVIIVQSNYKSAGKTVKQSLLYEF